MRSAISITLLCVAWLEVKLGKSKNCPRLLSSSSLLEECTHPARVPCVSSHWHTCSHVCSHRVPAQERKALVWLIFAVAVLPTHVAVERKSNFFFLILFFLLRWVFGHSYVHFCWRTSGSITGLGLFSASFHGFVPCVHYSKCGALNWS